MSVLTAEPDAVPADEEPPDAGERHRLTTVTGLAALSLDAMASVAYGPEATVLVLAEAGAHGLGFTLPVTLAIAALLAALVASYRQVIAAFPDGGGFYAVAIAIWAPAPAWWPPPRWSWATS
jgi:amino acid transporter